MPRLISIMLILALLAGFLPAYAAEKRSSSQGMVVWSMDEDGTAAGAGVRIGDVLLSCDGKPLLFTSSLHVILNRAMRDGKKSVKLELKRPVSDPDELLGDSQVLVSMSLDLPVRDMSDTRLVPEIPAHLVHLYTSLDTDRTVQAGQLSRAAREIEETHRNLHLAAWTWKLAFERSLDMSAEKRRAAEMYTRLSAKIGDRLSESEGMVFQGMIALIGDEPKSADRHYTSALKIQEELMPGSPMLSETLVGLGAVVMAMMNAAFAKSDYTRSGECADRLLQISERLASDGERKPIALQQMFVSLDHLAVLASLRDDTGAAREYMKRGLAVAEQFAPDSRPFTRDEAMLAALRRLGLLASMRDEWKDAGACYGKALAICERLSPDSLALADILCRLDKVARQLADPKAARGYLERALPIYERLSPGGSSHADTLHQLGKTVQLLNDLRAARDYYERALVIRERIAPDSMDVAVCLNDLAVVVHEQGDLPSVRKLHERALAIKERLAPGSESMATTLNNLGAVCREQGDTSAARGYYERGLEIRERLSPDSLAVAGSLNSLGLLALDEGNLDDALRSLKRALSIRERLAPDSIEVASTLGNLGVVYRDLGDLMTAEEYCSRSLTIRERLAPDSLSLASGLNSLGMLISDRGDIASARSIYERALAIQERLAPDSLSLAATVSNLGGLASEQGDFRTARECYDRALEIEQRLSPDSLSMATTLSNLGALVGNQGDHTAALDFLKPALAIRERLAPDSLELAHALNNIAGVLHDMGELEAALNHYLRALAIKQKLAPGSLGVAVTLGNIGVLAAELGDDKTARLYYERALVIRERLAPDSLDMARSLLGLGRLIGREGDTESALDHIGRAISLGRKHGGLGLLCSALYAQGRLQLKRDEKEAALGSFREAVDAFESMSHMDAESRERVLLDSESRLYDDLIRLLLRMNRPEEALKYLERAKSRAVVDALNVSSIRTGNEALAVLLKRYADLQTNLNAQQQTIEKEKAKPESERSLVKIEQLTRLLAQTKAEFYQVVNQIRKDYGAEYSALVQVEPTEFSVVQKQLPEGAVVVEYFPAEDKLYIFIVTRDSFKVKEHAVTRDQLDLWVEQVRQSMDDWKNGLGSDTPPEALVSLYDSIIKPVDEDISAGRTVVFVPSGTLCYLPFTALAKRDADGKLEYLVQRDKQFVTLTQMGLLGKLLENDKLASEGRTVGAIAFGNPTGIKPALPSAEEEVLAIADAYPDSRPFTGDDATEWRVKLQAQYGSIVHLATHAMLRHDDPNESYIALMEGENEDGRLTGGEVFGLPLEGTTLVVLSACQTAVAEENPGREISSLAQAFAIAGAPTVIASLWSVNDASTAKLMAELYRGLGQGKSKAAALRDAQRSLLSDEKHSHPFFWAGFTLLGAWE